MRFFFLLVTIAGLAAAIGYPFVVENFSGNDIGTIRLYERDKGFAPATVVLSAADSPVRINVVMVSLAQRTLSNARTVLNFSVADPQGATSSKRLVFANAQGAGDDTSSASEMAYQAHGGVIELDVTGPYVFSLAETGESAIAMKSVSMQMRANALAWDERVQPIGFLAAAIGFIGFVLSLRTATRRKDPAVPPRKWGR